jgi:hypothetical protein
VACRSRAPFVPSPPLQRDSEKAHPEKCE